MVLYHWYGVVHWLETRTPEPRNMSTMGSRTYTARCGYTRWGCVLWLLCCVRRWQGSRAGNPLLSLFDTACILSIERTASHIKTHVHKPNR